MKRMALVILGTAFLLGACGEEEAQPEPEKVETTVQEQDDKQEKAEQPEPEKEQTPEEKIRAAIEDTDVEVTSLNGQFIQAPYTVQVEFKGSENMTSKMTVKGFKMDMKYILYAIKQSGVAVEDIGNVGVSVTYPLVDKYGNSEDQNVIESDFTGDTLGKMTDDEAAFDFDNLPAIADNWWEHPAIQ